MKRLKVHAITMAHMEITFFCKRKIAYPLIEDFVPALLGHRTRVKYPSALKCPTWKILNNKITGHRYKHINQYIYKGAVDYL